MSKAPLNAACYTSLPMAALSEIHLRMDKAISLSVGERD